MAATMIARIGTHHPSTPMAASTIPATATVAATPPVTTKR